MIQFSWLSEQKEALGGSLNPGLLHWRPNLGMSYHWGGVGHVMGPAAHPVMKQCFIMFIRVDIRSEANTPSFWLVAVCDGVMIECS